MIRIGIVGCGRILAAHLRGYQLLREAGADDFRITALCSRNQDHAQMYVRRGQGPPQRRPVGTRPGDPLALGDIYLSDFQDDTEVEVYTDYRQMIASPAVNAINDLTSHELHHQVGEATLQAGKHLLTEKPLAITVAGARRMCDLAEKNNAVLGVLENARNRPDTRHLEWLFRPGSPFGALQLILMTNVGSWWAPDQIVAETPWRHLRESGGGITLDIGVHLFNHFRFVAGEIESITATTPVLVANRANRDQQGNVTEHIDCDADDTLLATFSTERGVTGSITASWAGFGGPTIHGSTRGIVYFGQQCKVIDGEVVDSQGQQQKLESIYEQQADTSERERYFPLGLQDPFALNQHDWLEAIRQGREPETSGRDGLRDLAVAYAALESHLAGRRVEVEEVVTGQLREFQRPLDEKYGLAD